MGGFYYERDPISVNTTRGLVQVWHNPGAKRYWATWGSTAVIISEQKVAEMPTHCLTCALATILNGALGEQGEPRE